MTIRLDGRVDVPVGAGVELEVIEAFAGVEQHRFRAGSGVELSIPLEGSRTVILRAVSTGDDLAPAPGEQRHGDLAAPGQVSQLEGGDFDASLTDAEVEMLNAQDRVLAILHQFLETEGQDIQQALYSELNQAHRVYVDARAVVEVQRLQGDA